MSMWPEDFPDYRADDEYEPLPPQVRSLKEMASGMMGQLVAAGNLALKEVSPEIANSNSELKRTWPLADIRKAHEAFYSHFLIPTALQPDELPEMRKSVPRPFYTGKVSYQAMLEAYKPNTDECETDPQATNVTVRFIQDFTKWIESMNRAKLDLAAAVALQAKGDANIRLFMNSPNVRLYFEWRTGTFNHLFDQPRGHDESIADGWVSEHVILARV